MIEGRITCFQTDRSTFLTMHICKYVSVWMCSHVCAGVYRDQKMPSDPLGLNLQGSCEPPAGRSTGEGGLALNPRVISGTCGLTFLFACF